MWLWGSVTLPSNSSPWMRHLCNCYHQARFTDEVRLSLSSTTGARTEESTTPAVLSSKDLFTHPRPLRTETGGEGRPRGLEEGLKIVSVVSGEKGP